MRAVPPQGSNISVTQDGADEVIRIPQHRANPTRFFAGAFITVWLGAWCFGFAGAWSKISSGQASGSLLFWLAGWTLGGLFALLTLYRMFRPAVPESLRLRSSGVRYDSGVRPMQLTSANRSEYWQSLFQKRTVVDLDRRLLKSLRLRETDSGNRLTVDVDSRRIELGQAAGEVGREWLFRTLTGRYT